MKITIYDITEWDDDVLAIRNDMAHAKDSDVMSLVIQEAKEIVEKGWENLPFVYKTDETNEDNAVAEAMEEYATYLTDYVYHIPTKCDYEIDEV